MPDCYRCSRSFNSYSALRQHEQNSPNHHLCDNWDKDFTSAKALKEHFVQSLMYDYCQHCDTHFDDSEELQDHYQTDHHFCDPCRKIFQNEYGLHDHWHYRQSGLHHYCVLCKRLFQNANNLSNHLNSSLHRPKDVPCPGKGCGVAFVSRSALILHLESSGCKSGADRQTINRYVRQYDTKNIITNPPRLLTVGTSDVTYVASERAWNGSAYECYLCHAGFRTLTALNQHLASPRHQEKIYVCPLNLCRESFTTLRGLCQHIESECCGVAKFKIVQNTMYDLMGRCAAALPY